MQTVFQLVPLQEDTELQLDLFQQSLPTGLSVEKRSDGIYLTIETSVDEDQRSQYFVDREIDRLFYLTGLRYLAKMCRKSVCADLKGSYSVHASLSAIIRPANWTYDLTLQVRLWSLASQVTDPFVGMLLLFQIIELSFPRKSDYPTYTDSTIAPDSLTECKLLRNLIARAGEASHSGLKNYCSYLGLPDIMLDRTDPRQSAIIASKLPIVETEARKCLSGAA